MTKREMTDRLRRRLVAGGATALAGAGLGTFARTALAQAASVELPIANGKRNVVAFPEKRPLIVLTTRPPQLETPFAVFNEGLITPNDAFFVRYHNNGIPTRIDGDTHVIKIGGPACGKPFQLTVSQLRTQFKPVEIVAVNQCSGNSRALFTPRVQGGQLTNGAMGNARWVGVPLKDVLARAELKNTAKQVTFNGLDDGVFGGGDLVKALDMNVALDSDAMIAYQMNGQDLPFLNGFPVRLIVPGYYGTYWVKHLSDIEVIDTVFDGFWMNPAYRIPDNDCACVAPGTTPTATRPIGRFDVRSFITSLVNGARVAAGAPLNVRGIAFDGGQGIREVAWSADGGQT
ncbi:MAG TPA: molybdopterin-dependent oxidoreductase, partial [Ramlibacter sp.]|nr:molybdopterin-dependent oxidoreductase [Ramlibacter sp.]